MTDVPLPHHVQANWVALFCLKLRCTSQYISRFRVFPHSESVLNMSTATHTPAQAKSSSSTCRARAPSSVPARRRQHRRGASVVGAYVVGVGDDVATELLEITLLAGRVRGMREF